jgi:hypothetical protein
MAREGWSSRSASITGCDEGGEEGVLGVGPGSVGDEGGPSVTRSNRGGGAGEEASNVGGKSGQGKGESGDKIAVGREMEEEIPEGMEIATPRLSTAAGLEAGASFAGN